MTLEQINNLPLDLLQDEFFKCCHSTRWSKAMAASRPFVSAQQMMDKSDEIWENTDETDWLEAFLGHPKIGVKQLSEKFASTKEWAGDEQASVKQASEDTIQALADGNDAYEAKFGFIYIICATGKSAQEMLDLLNARMPNDKHTEIRIAAGEQNKITKIRLNKLLS
jgi:2-oxo-4-hydroxy-4-carboxy-5-ureidoimidazoline decarboxylase